LGRLIKIPVVFVHIVEGYAGNVKEAARRETCADTFYDTFKNDRQYFVKFRDESRWASDAS
jgi:hypothetical protein